MQNTLPKISFIIPIKKFNKDMLALRGIERLPLEKIDHEIIIVEGSNPSLQRNIGAKHATGEILYFLDDDSELDSRALDYLQNSFADFPEIDGVGGPSIEFDRSMSIFQTAVGLAFSSTFGLGPSRPRYCAIGLPRIASENELILCNFALKKSTWMRNNGFEQRLYPNEENEFLDRLETTGSKFLHHPLLVVRRPPRATYRQLITQVFRYGTGRSNQIKITRKKHNLIQILPSLFLAYFVVLLATHSRFFIPTLAKSLKYGTLKWASFVLWLPVAIFISLVFLASLSCSFSLKRHNFKAILHLFAIFPIIHFGYGAGMIYGMFTHLNKPKSQLYKVIKYDGTNIMELEKSA